MKSRLHSLVHEEAVSAGLDADDRAAVYAHRVAEGLLREVAPYTQTAETITDFAAGSQESGIRIILHSSNT